MTPLERELLLDAIHFAETGAWANNPEKRRTIISKAGAAGEYQFMPETAKRFNVDVFDPADSRRGAGEYVDVLWDEFQSIPLVAASYNAGEGAVRKYKGVPPFPETQGYIEKVEKYMRDNPIQYSQADIEEAIRRKKESQYSKADIEEAIRRKRAADEVEPTTANKIKRSFGSNTRALMEGAPMMMDAITYPFRLGYSKLTDTPMPWGLSDWGTFAADKAGLPADSGIPETITRTVAGFGGTAIPAMALKSSIPMLAPLAENLGVQLSSAVGAGTGAGLAENAGFGPAGQIGGAVLGALAVPATIGGGAHLWNKARAVIPQWTAYSDDALNTMFGNKGIDLSGLTIAAKRDLFNQTRNALAFGDVDDAALRRLVDFHRVGARPTRGAITQDPAQVTREMNAAKIAANQGDDALTGLPRLQNENNATLIRNLNRLGADTTDDAVDAGAKIIGSVRARDARAAGKESALYGKAKESLGRTTEMDGKSFVNRANELITKENAKYYVPPEIRSMLDDIADGTTKFTVDLWDTMRTQVATHMRGANGNAMKALNAVRRALNEVEPTGVGAETRRTLEQAKRLAWKRRTWQESAPGIKAALDNQNPDTFVEKFIIAKGVGAGEVETLLNTVRRSPEAFQAARMQVVKWLKTKALSEAADEVGKFSQSAYNRALSRIGDKKLISLFSPEEIQQLKSVGRVASYTQVQPSGSAVNNSNTASLMLGKLIDWVGAAPVIKPMVTDPLQALSGRYGAWQAQRLTPGLLQTESLPVSSKLLYPGLLAFSQFAD